MSKKTSSDLLQLLVIIGCALLLIEFIFLDTGLLFLAVLGAFGLYIGKKSFDTTTGKTIFWGGAFFIFLAVINTFVIRFFIFVIIIYFVWNWYQNKEKEKNRPKFIDVTEETLYEDRVIKNKWFGKYHTTEEAFAWQDLNIQSAVGDVVVDLNNTMLPREESVMVIRHLIGNITIIVPYDVEVTIDHSIVFGDIEVFDHQEKNAFNRTIQLQTKGYQEAPQKIKIYTQLIAGKLEVRRG